MDKLMDKCKKHNVAIIIPDYQNVQNKYEFFMALQNCII